MRTSHTHNKMKPLGSDTKVRFNVAMHGIGKDQVVNYNSMPADKQMLIRRRLSDDDGSVEVVMTEKKAPASSSSSSSSRSSSSSKPA